MADTLTLETGQNAQRTVKEESKQDLEPAQTLLLHTEELIVLETALKPKNAIRSDVVSICTSFVLQVQFVQLLFFLKSLHLNCHYIRLGDLIRLRLYRLTFKDHD